MPSISRTKRELARSVKELMQTVPLEHLSVSDIVERAGIGRNTFYYHFQDKYDLVNWIFKTEAMELIDRNVNLENWDKYLDALEQYFRINQVFYTNALTYSGQNCLQDFIYEIICQRIVKQLEDLPETEKDGMTPEGIAIAGEMVASTFIGMLVRWTRKGMQDTRGFHECMRRIVDGTLAKGSFGNVQNKVG